MFAKLLIASALLTTPVPAAPLAPASTVNLTVAAADAAGLRVETRAAGSLTVDILTTSGVVAARLGTDDPVEAASERTFAIPSASLDDGTYRGRVALVRTDGVTETAETTVEVDRSDPRVRLRARSARPTPGPTAFRIRVDDTGPLARAEWVVAAQTGEELARIPLRTPALGRWSTRTWNGRITGRRVQPGVYRVQVRVVDAAGNAGTSPVRRVRVQRAVRARTVYSAPAAKGMIALTFDDCASADAWRRLLDGLQTARARATFFCNGRNVAAYPDLARRTVAEGHAIGSHTWDHPIMPRLSGAAQRSQIERDVAVWWRVAQALPTPYFRAPYGSQDASTLAAAGAAGFGYAVLWDVDPRDWEEPGAGVVAERVVSRSRGGSIVVMHTSRSAAGGLAEMVRRLRAKGLEPVALDEMPGLSPVRRG